MVGTKDERTIFLLQKGRQVQYNLVWFFESSIWLCNLEYFVQSSHSVKGGNYWLYEGAIVSSRSFGTVENSVTDKITISVLKKVMISS